MDYIVYTINLKYYENLRDLLLDAQENGLTFQMKQAIDLAWQAWCVVEQARLRELLSMLKANNLGKVPPYSELSLDCPEQFMSVHSKFQLLRQQCLNILKEQGVKMPDA